MTWSKWARQQKGNRTQIEICKHLGGISQGCFWRMAMGNEQPNAKNLERISKAKGILVWELMKEVYEISNEKAKKFDDFAA